MSSSVSRYAPVQIGLHWLIFLLFAFNFIVSDGICLARDGHGKRRRATGGFDRFGTIRRLLATLNLLPTSAVDPSSQDLLRLGIAQRPVNSHF
ncbi:hypothetical protein [Celeribacter sp.]|uniref:hypothetical protein n=1 Tax=Celeribacter sp. TaxID=1890673 RepID=UPI003A935351